MHPLLDAHADRAPAAIAMAAPGRAPLTFSELRRHLGAVTRALNDLGIGRHDRVAVVGASGPELAVAIIGVAASATCAPLNPAYRASEYDFYLSDLGVDALVIQKGVESAARSVATARGIRVIELSPVAGGAAGLFTLSGDGRPAPAHPGAAQPDDVALLLHTSGTTSRPKMVPLTQANLCASSDSIRDSLGLAPGDRCLNVMPLFHIHGLMATLSSLLAGAAVVCPPAFEVSKFFSWMDECRPTWCTAVPTIHRAISRLAHSHRDVVTRCPLRFVRSSSAPLPTPIAAALENAFSVPVIEAYGMTEASHQIASNPLPPRERRTGSVGRATGAEVAVMDVRGRLLPAGETGEIVIRGANVFQGYAGDAAANAAAFSDGWFRTGDQGRLDPEGYLFITGRLKEIINRGGQKISPAEIDDVLARHPAVGQAVAFAVPHVTLGEDVGAAIVLREDATATEREIREFVAARLADFKVPSRVLIVDRLPEGATGKLQRVGLAAKLGLRATDRAGLPGREGFAPPRTPLETTLAEIWAEILELGAVSIHDNFFSLGGDSIRATLVASRLSFLLGIDMPLRRVFESLTVAELAEAILEQQAEMIGTEAMALLLAEVEGEGDVRGAA